jgi:hypothetical protein
VGFALLDRLGIGWQLLDALAAVEPASVMTGRIAAGVRAREESFLTAVEREIWLAGLQIELDRVIEDHPRAFVNSRLRQRPGSNYWTQRP